MRVLFIPVGDSNIGSSRLRAYQYIPYLESAGIFTKIVFIQKSVHVLRLLWDIISIAWHACSADAVIIQKRLLPPGFVRALKTVSRVIYDYDDAIYLNDDCTESVHLARLVYTLKKADLVIAGNSELRRYALQYNQNVIVIPTPVPDICRIDSVKRPDDKIVLGWIGSKNNLKYLEPLKDIFTLLQDKYGDSVTLKVISDGEYAHNTLRVENIPWSMEAEKDGLSSIDIGLMPLEDNEWTRGKCSFKAILYMSYGIPTVASPVGMNKDLISNGKDGFLARGKEEWYDALGRLVSDGALRKRIGMAGRSTVEKGFVARANSEVLINYVRRICEEA